ncbi:hypothetical protein V3C99_011701 [Haemonchus contortus]
MRKILCSLHELQDRLRYRAKVDGGASATTNAKAALKVPFPQVYFKQQEPDIASDISFQIFADEIFKVFSRFQKQRLSPNISRTQAEGIRELQGLVKSHTIRLSVIDKGGEFVVISNQIDRAITERHLEDSSLYQPCSIEEFQAQFRRLNRQWMAIAKSASLDSNLIARLKLESPRCPVLYPLIKTHKFSPADNVASITPSSVKVRPIISCVGGPTDRIAWFLNVILTQLLRFIPSHLTNTHMFLDQLRRVRLSETCAMESFDVESLYTNVSNDAAMEAVLELLSQHESTVNMHGLSIGQIMVLLKECLNCNIFRWSGKYYAQTRGLAMGQRLAPTLAIAFMAKIEVPVLERLPMLYCRYIDDCFIVCSTQDEVDLCFDLLNAQSERIKVTREKPHEEWLPFLNVQVRTARGDYSTKWYRKHSNKNILVHWNSAHPLQTKRAVVRSMFRTAAEVSSGEKERKESVNIARNIAELNGYKLPPFRKARAGKESSRTNDDLFSTKIPFAVPFISDEVSTSIRKCLRRAGLQNTVGIVEIPPDNLKRRLVRNRMYDRTCATPNCVVCPSGREGDCSATGVAYKITCQNCGKRI